MMPPSLKQAVKAGVASPIVWPLFAKLLPPAIVVLAYHRVSVADDPFRHVDVSEFRSQMEWLRRHCTIIDPLELPPWLEFRTASARLPVLITFDDGYRDYYEHAFPVLKAFDIPAVNFVATKFIDDGELFWWDVVDLACKRTPLTEVALPWTERRFAARTAAHRMAIYRECQQHLKQLAEADKQAMLPVLLAALQVSVDTLGIDRQVMTWDQIRQTRPLTTYGGHLHSHPLVSRISVASLETELAVSHDRMTRELGDRPRLFAYPDGDMTDEAKAAVQRHGYETAFGITTGFVRPGADRLALRRLPGPQSVEDLAWRITELLRR